MSNTENEGFNKIRNLLSCRQVLNILTMLGFMLNYALRVNLTIAIVQMVQPETQLDSNSTNTTDFSSEQNVEDTKDDRFAWDSYHKNFVLGCFFGGYILTELPGGRLAELIGGRRVFGHSMFWASLLTLITPLAAHISYVALIIVRVVLGFMLGASWPAIHPVAAVWIPPMERSRFMSNMMASSLGAAITMPICGFLMDVAGWSSVFYLTGAVGLLWSFAWFTFVYETPATHPRISPEERREIEEAIGTTTSKIHASRVPWGQLLSSSAVWAIIVTHALSVYGFFTLVHQLPTYMETVLKFDIKENGLFSSLPYLGKYVMAFSSSCYADYLRKKRILSTTATRKIFTSFALLTPGFLMVAQVFLGRDAAWSVIIFTFALFTHGAVTAGYLGNGLDIAPNFSGTIFGLANTFSSLGGFLSSGMVAMLMQGDESNYRQWQKVFWVLAVTYISGALVYVVLGSGELQSWNNESKITTLDSINIEEEVPLKSTKIRTKINAKAEK
ncbi:sialin [Teleopsis dalmanni]|uniref:sialin n=1 Tax=Teleopsis dalmanni TaxID=139649 RepID=UPI0018CF0041|nr:sialin [Teleopsis dalmanni]XP_037958155.1 sialin [Teleopsis dalmanni]